jgi:hypothetical protein
MSTGGFTEPPICFTPLGDEGCVVEFGGRTDLASVAADGGVGFAVGADAGGLAAPRGDAAGVVAGSVAGEAGGFVEAVEEIFDSGWDWGVSAVWRFGRRKKTAAIATSKRAAASRILFRLELFWF